MLYNTVSKFTTWKETFLRKIHMSYKYWKIVKITAYVCKHTRVFRGFWEKLSKRNKKCEICYNNFALWKIETIVDVKYQKQPPRGVLKILVEMFHKLNSFLLNSHFCSFQIFYWFLITDLIISKDFSFGFFTWTSPY